MPNNIFAMHDPGAEELIIGAGKTGYTVHTEAIGCDPNDRSGKAFNTFGGKIVNLVRLNNGYGSTGTIPLPAHYADFAQRCANYAAASTGAALAVFARALFTAAPFVTTTSLFATGSALATLTFFALTFFTTTAFFTVSLTRLLTRTA